MILPGSLFIDYLDYLLCSGYLIGLMFLLRPIACLLTLAFWISPLYVDRSDCYSGFDPLPAFSYVFVVTAFNKLPHMDSHSASVSSLQISEDHVTLKSAVMMLKIQLCFTGIHFKIENQY